MAVLVRLTPFAPGTLIQSAQVNAELNELVDILSGVSTTQAAVIRLSSGSMLPLTLDQTGAGPIQHWLQNGSEKSRIQNNGSLRINSSQAQDAPSIGINNDANNLAGLGIVGVIQTTGSGQI